MGINLRYPNITAQSEREQLVQLKSYIHQLVGELQWAFNTIDTSNSSNVVVLTPKSTAPRSSVNGRTLADAQATFDDIKALIIKSADIVEAYYDEISTKLEGVYVAESDFGSFVSQTEQNITKSSTDIGQAFTNIQTITTDIGNVKTGIVDINDNIEDVKKDIKDVVQGMTSLERTIIEVNANIRTGCLYYDEKGIPVYGLEVGQRTMLDGVEVFNKYARFTSSKLSFYDQNGTEVAYISDRKLYINHVEVRGTFRMGGLVKTVLADGSIVKRWVNTGGK